MRCNLCKRVDKLEAYKTYLFNHNEITPQTILKIKNKQPMMQLTS